MQIILGIDPGSCITGYGVIRSDGQKHSYIASGSLKITAKSLEQRLLQVFHGLQQVICLYQPEEGAIEQVFMSTNANSALKLGQARGVAIVAMASRELEVAEYSPRSIKQAVVGYGAAAKEQVQHMVTLLLNLSGKPSVDGADALAVAICHAQTRRTAALLQRLHSQT